MRYIINTPTQLKVIGDYDYREDCCLIRQCEASRHNELIDGLHFGRSYWKVIVKTFRCTPTDRVWRNTGSEKKEIARKADVINFIKGKI